MDRVVPKWVKIDYLLKELLRLREKICKEIFFSLTLEGKKICEEGYQPQNVMYK